ncbi:hypothetical protein [Anaeromyxobacter diazotrophicus]|uniref:Peptidase M43 pregnancy-associated plasma-A domain-containing protein n=1 Tax=Anaeromyxobacter diazotrophicus TaxID=2590199 RepID=A0A7I9VT93_9BACT|nr:hypothetical protein [Anaeromyxobacter diazotrophicus]GEJ59350.1 hypothetical protein AMYX_40910 [Anaeromyxobacter diazotrophicus]
MRPSPLLLALALVAAACGGNSSTPAATKCPQKPCDTGLTCQPDGTCAVVTVSPDGGIAACGSGDVKPVGDSSLAAGSQATGAAYVLKRETHTVGTSMTFDVPAGTASLTLVEQATKAPDVVTFVAGGSTYQLSNTAVPHTLTSPDPTFKFNDVDDGQLVLPDYSILPVYFFSDSPATGTLTLPNTTKGLSVVAGGGLPPGTWSALVSDYAYECAAGIGKSQLGYDSCTGGALDSTYDVTVIAKPVVSGAIPSSGTLDVVVYFVATAVDGIPLNKARADAGQDSDVNRLVQTLRGLYGKNGVTVNVTFQDAPPSVQTRFASGVNIDQTGACSDLSQLFTSSAKGNTLNIFLVPSLNETATSGQATYTVGIDGTIPGPASVGGTVASGAAVSAADLRHNQTSCSGSGFVGTCGADETAYIIAHEAGHFLGLYHVTEKYGFEFDTLDDTFTCTCQACAPSGSVCATATAAPPSNAYPMSDVSKCVTPTASKDCGGGDNLMFWLFDQIYSKGTLSTQQGQVVRANPLIH